MPVSDSLYQQTLDYIYGFVNYETMPVTRDAAHFDLRRMAQLLDALGNPHLAAKSVHIAGTKGKGSTAAMVASVLTAAGYKTGLYTSPHLSDLRERIQIDGRLISQSELSNLVRKFKPRMAAVDRTATYGKLTTFEVLTALAFSYFAEHKADFQVLEVGLGGRLDATNVITPEVSVITAISLDHTEVLGKTLPAIATEKAGIIKPGISVVSSPQTREVMEVIEETTRKNGARLLKVGREMTWQVLGYDLTGQRLEVKGLLDRYELEISLLGLHQMENAAVAVAALELLIERGYIISRDSIVSGLARVKWPGRFDILSRDPFIVVDGAHNRESARLLGESLKRYFSLSRKGQRAGEGYLQFDRNVLVMGASFDKDVDGIISELGPLFDRFIVTGSQHPRAMSPELLRDKFAEHRLKAEVSADIPAALLLATGEGGNFICVTGYLFVVGEAMEEVARWRYRPQW
jgi:dihydrofolate synthase/folylpolyglutamate synthase